jgi:predicted nucleotidyltransferase
MAVYVPPVTRRKRIPRKAIEDLVRQIVENFHPQKIILFGSYARGNPRPESDVDLLVVMKSAGTGRQSLRIREALDINFGVDLIVHTPEQLRQRIEWGDSFLKDITREGKIVYESTDA